MALSVCCLTDQPAGRVEAIMRPFHAVADEVVIAADTRVSGEDLDGYRRAADRVIPVEVDYFEAHLKWLHDECRGDWIFRIDGDEVASPELVALLPELVRERNLQQYWFPRRWLDPSGRGWYDELPWAPEFHNRLVRRDPRLPFAGTRHSSPGRAWPARYVTAPIYHLLCAVEPREERLHRSLVYEITAPERVAPGGGPFNATFYLPERFARRPPVPVPEPDRPAVESALAA